MKALVEVLIEVLLTNLLLVKVTAVLTLHAFKKVLVTWLLPHLPEAILAAIVIELIKLYFFH